MSYKPGEKTKKVMLQQRTNDEYSSVNFLWTGTKLVSK